MAGKEKPREWKRWAIASDLGGIELFDEKPSFVMQHGERVIRVQITEIVKPKPRRKS